jgi:hypothetical protein
VVDASKARAGIHAPVFLSTIGRSSSRITGSRIPKSR